MKSRWHTDTRSARSPRAGAPADPSDHRRVSYRLDVITGIADSMEQPAQPVRRRATTRATTTSCGFRNPGAWPRCCSGSRRLLPYPPHRTYGCPQQFQTTRRHCIRPARRTSRRCRSGWPLPTPRCIRWRLPRFGLRNNQRVAVRNARRTLPGPASTARREFYDFLNSFSGQLG
jgi:hypothetical protein